VFAARNERNILAGPREPSAEVSTHATCSKNHYSH
jgi:hypothetical protein